MSKVSLPDAIPMLDTAAPLDPLNGPSFGPPTSRARTTLAKRLADIVCLPTSRITPQERHLAADLLIEMLKDGDVALRQRCARRIAALSDAPSVIVRLLARDVIDVARPILEGSEALSDSDLVATAVAGTAHHRLLIAQRRQVSELVADALSAPREASVVEALLQNSEAVISGPAIEQMVADSRTEEQYCRLLARRPELSPSLALAMFWWANAETRKLILRRFAVERHILQEAAADVFGMAAEEGWKDPLARKALQFIERRQRNRAAVEKSPYAGLEDAIQAAARQGLDRKLVEEISYLSGLKPATGAQIFTDQGGEPLAVLCKATGLRREALGALWEALRRKRDDAPDSLWSRAIDTFDTLSTDKAQTVLRYWNWALTSAVSPALVRTLEDTPSGELSAAELSARLVFGRR